MLKLYGNALRLALGVWSAVLILNNNEWIAVAVPAANLVAETTTGQHLSQAEPDDSFLETIDLSSVETNQINQVPSTAFSISNQSIGAEPAVNPTSTQQVAAEEKTSTVTPSINELSVTSVDELATDSMEQVTSVSQLRDVQPTDWAFQALQTVIERYGCLAGYPDGTYRGDRAITRYEFAAGLNACLERINQLIQSSNPGNVSQEDFARLQRLQAEFTPELATLQQRVDNLQSTVTRLERQAISSTTVLNGEILFAVSGVGGHQVNNGQEIDANIVLSQRTELNLSTSFYGADLLRARLAAANTPDFATVTGTNFSRLSFTGDNNNNVQIGALFYRFPVGQQAIVMVGAQGIGFGDIAPTLNPYINNSLLGNVGNFSGESAIYALNGGRGIGLEYRFSRAVRLSLGYLPGNANNPKAGLFGGPYGAIAQLTLLPTDPLTIGLTYVHSYKIVGTGKGSRNAENPFDGAATSTNAYGVQASYQVSPRFNISGWTGLISAHAESNPNQGSNAKIFTWALTFGLADLGGLGNLAGFVIGQPPKVIESDVVGRKDPNTSLHLEAFYRYQVTDNISITPGFFVITNPEHNASNDLIYIGTLRTSFVF